jgi:hypothetical protein
MAKPIESQEGGREDDGVQWPDEEQSQSTDTTIKVPSPRLA